MMANYKVPCPECGSEMRLAPAPSAKGTTFQWQCLGTTCSFNLDTGVPHSEEVASFNLDKGWAHYAQTGVSPEIATVYMPAFLTHFAECTWGGCRESLFENIIHPNLKAPAVLDALLRSNTIKPMPNVIQGENGARVFPELLEKLKQVDSPEIQRYLEDTFRDS
jgi:hypothetical protein